MIGEERRGQRRCLLLCDKVLPAAGRRGGELAAAVISSQLVHAASRQKAVICSLELIVRGAIHCSWCDVHAQTFRRGTAKHPHR